MPPSEFWTLTLPEFWLIYDAKYVEPKAGSLTQNEFDECYQALKDARANA